MDYSISQQPTRKIAGFHLVGPWEQTVKQGFEQLSMWVSGRHVPALEWLAVYYDNPDEVAPEKLRCDTVVTVADDFTLPANSEGVILTEVAGGDYASATARVEGDDFATPWNLFFASLLEDANYQIAPKPCIERYLNDGRADGYWTIEMLIPVVPKAA